MSLPLVLVHGGAHGAWCWDPIVPFLDGPVLAVDLPPKRIRSGGAGHDEVAPELATLSVDELATSILADVDAVGFERFVLVGHSLAGVSIPEVARRVPERVAHLVFVSCSVPPEGGSVFDLLPSRAGRDHARSPPSGPTRERSARSACWPTKSPAFMFCNDMDEEQERFVLDRLCPESQTLIAAPVSARRDLPDAAEDVRAAHARPGARARDTGAGDRKPARVAGR